MIQDSQLPITAVKSTGIFCVPDCPAKPSLQKNRRPCQSAFEALALGFRPCKRCKPLSAGAARPDWLDELLTVVEKSEIKRFTNRELANLGFNTTKIRTWFGQRHKITLQGYLRLRRLAVALKQIEIDASQPNLNKSFSRMRAGFESVFHLPYQQANADPLLINRFETTLGPMICVAADTGVALLEYADRRMLETNLKRVSRIFKRPLVPGQHPLMVALRTQMAEYYSGSRTDFEIPLMYDGTRFQQTLWRELEQVPPGQTTTYGRLAKKLGVHGGARAVGRANGDNRFTIVVPCHRVIGSDGNLTGYGGGLWRKQWLLDHERTVTACRQDA